MNLLLAAVLLVQDKSAEESLTKLETSIDSSETISFSYSERMALTINGSVDISYVTTGTFLLKKGGKVAISEEHVDTIYGTTTKGVGGHS